MTDYGFGQIRAGQSAGLAHEALSAAQPASAKHPALVADGIGPHEFMQDGSDLLVPLYRDRHVTPMPTPHALVNVIRVSPEGQESTLTIEIPSAGPQGTRPHRVMTKGLVAIMGRPSGAGLIGAIAGAEAAFFDGRLAGAERVYLCTGWRNGAAVQEMARESVVAALQPEALPDLAQAMRRNLPAATTITIASDRHCRFARDAAETINARLLVPFGGLETFYETHLSNQQPSS